MKKSLVPIISFVFVLALVLGSFGTANASPEDPPVVTPISGDADFITEIVPIASLPGVTQLPSHMLVPVGFPEGEAQFGGNGIRVSGMSSGKATACFSLYTVAVKQGWGGFVGVWNGKKWVKLATAITTPEESSTSLACAAISGNGTYAFIKYIKYIAAVEKPQATMAECDFDVEIGPTGYTTQWHDGYSQGWMTGAMFVSNTVLTDLPVSVRLLRTDPDGHLILEGTGYGQPSQFGQGVYGTVFDDFLWWTELDGPFNSWTYYVTFGNCYKIIDYVPPQEV